MWSSRVGGFTTYDGITYPKKFTYFISYHYGKMVGRARIGYTYGILFRLSNGYAVHSTLKTVVFERGVKN